MDPTVLKTLLESQERAYKIAMDAVVKQMNDRVHTLEEKLSEQIRSLEFSQKDIDDLKANIKIYETEKKEDQLKILKLMEQVESSNTKIKDLEDRLNYQDDYSRRNNIRISGLEERDGGETWEQTATSVTNMLEGKMQMPGLDLERAHRVGVRRDARPRTVVARFTRYCDREAVMRVASRLKATNIYLNDDLCPASQAAKNAQMPLLKQARAEGKIAYFRHTKLIIKERNNEGATSRVHSSADASAGGGGAGGVSHGGQAAVDGVASVEGAGAWSGGRYEAFSSLPTSRPDGSPLRTPSASGAPTKANQATTAPATRQSGTPQSNPIQDSRVKNRLRKK